MDTVFVGGAEGFLGRNTVLHYLRAGKRVVGSVWKSALADELQAWLQREGALLARLEVFPANLSREAEVAQLVQDVEAKYPEIAHLVNCVGGFEWVKVTQATRDQVDFLFQANFFSNWLLLKHWGPRLQQKPQARVAFVSAAASMHPAAEGMGLYVASKAALNSVIQAASAEWKETGVRVGAVYPTIIDTPRNRADMPNADFSQWMPVSQVIQKIDKILSE